jgi:hypothetical protein
MAKKKAKARAVAKSKKSGNETKAVVIGIVLLIISVLGMTNPPVLNYGWNLAILFLCSAILMLYGSIVIKLKY